jgi:predicted YcjX-like family ATPase
MTSVAALRAEPRLSERMRKWAEDAPIAQRTELKVVMKAWANEVEAVEKTAEAEKEKFAYALAAALSDWMSALKDHRSINEVIKAELSTSQEGA